MTPDTIAEVNLMRQLKGKKAAIQLLLKNGGMSEPFKETLKPQRKTKRNKKQKH